MIFLDLAALIFFIFLAPIPIFWGIFQANAKFWKRFGRGVYVASFLFYTLVTALTLKYTGAIIAYRTIATPTTIAIGLVLIIVGGIVASIAMKELSLTTLVALPQLLPERYASKLVTTGLYSKMRHPRYLGFWVMALGFWFATGLWIMWILFVWSLIGFVTLGILEERELQQRFGKSYKEYMQRVPRFLPKIFS